MTPLRADAILACLQESDVRYVLIGGLAAILHGSPQTTFDADICPAREDANLEKLAAALRHMNASIRTPDAVEGLRFACDAGFLRGVEILNLVTDFGELDISFAPAGTGGYEDLIQRAFTLEVKGYRVPVAALEDIIRSKEAANRPKDQAALPLLRELLRELRRKDSGSG